MFNIYVGDGFEPQGYVVIEIANPNGHGDGGK